MRGLFNQCGLPYLWNIGVVNIIPIREMKQIIVDQYLQEWSSSLIGTTGKLRLYKLCKDEFIILTTSNVPEIYFIQTTVKLSLTTN